MAGTAFACSDTSAPADQNSPATVESTPADQTRPAVVSKIPEPGAAGVTLGSVVRAAFSEPLDPNSLNGDVLSVRSSEGELVQGTFSPSAPLSPGTSYTVTVTTDARDRAGNGLAVPGFTSNFYTTPTPDIKAPEVWSSDPVDGSVDVRTNGVFTVTFTEPVDERTVTTVTFYLRNAATGDLVEGTVRRDNYATQNHFLTPRFELAKNTRYTVTLTTGIRDYAGNSMAKTKSFSFTTAP